MTARLALRAGAVARAIAFTRSFAAAGRLSQESADRLVVIVEEWVANIVEHGRAPAGSRVVLRLERVGSGVRLSFSDAGVAFDLQAAEDTGPNLERGGGAGIALIRSWSDIESYERSRGRNRLALRSRS